MSAVVTVLALGCFLLAYRFYARYVGERIYRDREEIRTPAYEFEDGQDYVPTNRHILWGHHFTSIAGAAPIIGPCIAAYWGWLPALLWVVLGTIFMGAVHDFGALVVSVRERGRSIADIANGVLSGRARIMFLCFVLVLVWLVLAVFAMAIAGLFVSQPTSVLPINIEIVVAIVIGWLIYKRRMRALVPSLVALAILYLFVWFGTMAPLRFEDLGLSRDSAMTTWIVILFVYSAIASLLPVWLLLQPRDFINSHQLMVGLGLLFAGLFVAHPEFDAPMVRTTFEGGAPSLWPLLFVTIACGAISGFHGLVASGTTSKQLDRLPHARLVGYGGMIGEGSLALASTMAAVAGIGLVGACSLPSLGGAEVPDLGWAVYYDSFVHAAQNKATAFVVGGGEFLMRVGLGAEIARTLMAVLVISFAATTLDTATRIERFIVSEIGSALRIRVLENRVVATAVAVGPAILLALWKVPDPASGAFTSAGWVLWPIFGASNQMLAALTLMVLSLYFWRRKRPVLPLLLPMLFVMAVTLASLLVKAGEFLRAENWLLLGITVVQLTLVLWMLLEGVASLARRGRSEAAPARE